MKMNETRTISVLRPHFSVEERDTQIIIKKCWKYLADKCMAITEAPSSAQGSAFCKDFQKVRLKLKEEPFFVGQMGLYEQTLDISNLNHFDTFKKPYNKGIYL